jgi:hypothetical protein
MIRSPGTLARRATVNSPAEHTSTESPSSATSLAIAVHVNALDA